MTAEFLSDVSGENKDKRVPIPSPVSLVKSNTTHGSSQLIPSRSTLAVASHQYTPIKLVFEETLLYATDSQDADDNEYSDPLHKRIRIFKSCYQINCETPKDLSYTACFMNVRTVDEALRDSE